MDRLSLMNNTLEDFSLQCPNCGEAVDIFVDSSVEQQVYVEDCPVCCRPIEFRLEVSSDHESLSLTTRRDDD